MLKKVKSSKTTISNTNEIVSWKHPGGKLLRLGPERCTDNELLAILIGTGVPGQEAISCSTEEEGRYLKIFLEVEWDEVLVPENLDYLKHILPQLIKIFLKVKEAIHYYTDSILDARLKEQITRIVWQKSSEMSI